MKETAAEEDNDSYLTTAEDDDNSKETASENDNDFKKTASVESNGKEGTAKEGLDETTADPAVKGSESERKSG